MALTAKDRAPWDKSVGSLADSFEYGTAPRRAAAGWPEVQFVSVGHGLFLWTCFMTEICANPDMADVKYSDLSGRVGT
jgi:hypothetical protein